MKLLAVLRILIFFTFSPFLKATACSCITRPLKQSIPLFSCIITGNFIHGDKLEEISEMNNNKEKVYYTGKFIVSKILKGNNIKRGDTIIISSDYSNCSMLFKNNSSYLLFANANEHNLFVSICSYSGVLDDKKNRKILKQTKKLVSNISDGNQSNR